MTTEELLAICTTHGLTIADLDQFNIGNLIDYLYAYNKMINQDNDQQQSVNKDYRIATQTDFDAFDKTNNSI